MNPNWPRERSSQYSVKDSLRIEEALGWITTDLLREENAAVWPQLQALEPRRTLIQLFDSVWWMYFRKLEPVRAP
jgi:hypothetical protein